MAITYYHIIIQIVIQKKNYLGPSLAGRKCKAQAVKGEEKPRSEQRSAEARS